MTPKAPNRRKFAITAAAAILAATLVPPSIAQEAEKKTTLRVLCYNIHWALGMDGEYDVERIAKVIQDADPDLVALQEVDVGVERSGRVHQVRELAKLTGMAARFGPTQHYQGGLFGNAILTRLPILDTEIHPLPHTEETPERKTYPRGIIAVTVEAPDGKALRFLSTHFQHNVPEDRVAQAVAINELFGEDDLRTILAGDINATPEEEPVQILLEKWSNATDDPPSPTIPVEAPTKRIDYIFYRTGGRGTIELVEAKVIPETVASDHRPVFAELSFIKSSVR